MKKTMSNFCTVLVNAFFDMAELKAERHKPMYMRDWLKTLDAFSRDFGMGVLENAGRVSHETAMEKAHDEYAKYRRKTLGELSPVEHDFLAGIKAVQKN